MERLMEQPMRQTRATHEASGCRVADRRPMYACGSRLRTLAVAGLLGVATAPSLAQDGLSPAEQRAIDELAGAIEERARINTRFLELERDFSKAFLAREWATAEAALSEQISLKPQSFIPYYNLACVNAMRGDTAAAFESLVLAVEKGFDDAHQLRRDPHLASIRTDPAFANLLAAWPRVIELRRDANLRALGGFYADGYTNDLDESRRLAFRSSYDDTTTARAEAQRVGAWAEATLFPDLFDHDAQTDDPWVVVVLPNDRDFTRWQVSEFGPQALRAGGATVGGLYDHDAKRLVVRDLGATLRHEVMHVYHWRDMTRRGQRHPTWIQEGLGAIVEDLDPPAEAGSGLWTPVRSWRTNTARRLAELNRLSSVRDLASMSPRGFSERRPLATYAEVRSFFLWLLEQGKLEAWYRDYTEHYDEDPTGIASLERVLERDADAIDRDFRAWARTLEPVPETGSDLAGTLGIQVDGGAGDGPEITGFANATARRQLSLERGDVLTAINGRPVRDLQELVRVLSAFAPGDTVTLSIRRGREHLSVQAPVQPRR